MSRTIDEKTIYRNAEIDGKIVPYDVCSQQPDTYNESKFKCIGFGQVHSIDGVRQTGKTDYYFFVRSDNDER